MHQQLRRLLNEQSGVITTAQASVYLTRRGLEAEVRRGGLTKLWHGIYGYGDVNLGLQLRGLDLFTGTTVAACLGTAAAVYGFDTEDTAKLHVLDPGGQLRTTKGLVVHRRDGAPLVELAGRPATAPAWTAIEVARGLRRPRVLATLDAALRSRRCTAGELDQAVIQQSGRRGIVAVRDLLPLANPLAESPMESEARLVMIDGGLPHPVLQHEIMDRDFRIWRVDFAWPEQRLAVEYDGLDWHSGPAAFVYDRKRRAALQEVGWTVLAIIADDVRRRQSEMVRRIEFQLARAEAA